MFDGLEQHVNGMMNTLAGYGPLGMFLIALPANTTLVIQVPYSLPMLTLLLYADTFWEVIAIGAATGLGGGIGEVLSYKVARAILARVNHLEDSRLFCWTKNCIERRPGVIPYLVWSASAMPIPDLVMIVPVAMVKYPWRKMMVPMVSGKVFHNIMIAFLFRYAAHSASGLVSTNLNLDLAALLVVMFVIIIAYQVEKSRLAKSEACDSPAALTAAVEPCGSEAFSPLGTVGVFETETESPLGCEKRIGT